jgi:AcrR family transcriptional regulator
MTELVKVDIGVRRAELLDAAAYLFATRGYHATSMRELAKHLKIKAGSLYYHIDSKEQLLNEICAIGMKELILNVDQAIDSNDALPGRVRAIVAGHARVIDSFGDYLRCYENDYAHLSADTQEEMRLELIRFHRKIDEIFQEAASKGAVRADLNIKTARYAVIAVLFQLSRVPFDQHPSGLDELAEGFSDILIHGFIRRPAAAQA